MAGALGTGDRGEPGARRLRLFFDPSDPDVVCAFQQYASADDAAEFVQTDAYRTYEREVAPLLQGPPDVRPLTPLWSKRQGTSAGTGQDLRVLEGRYQIEYAVDEAAPVPQEGWLALVRGPDGRTAIRPASQDEDGGWCVLWSGDEPHDPQATGMLSAIVAPLADVRIPVMIASTYHADLVLVPATRLDEAVNALRAAGHRVVR